MTEEDRVKRLFFVMALLVYSVTVLGGCASLHPTAQVDTTAAVSALPPYSGPKARIVVADFEAKVAKVTSEVGAGLREILVSALINTNRFSIVERQVLNKSADLFIAAAVAEFEPQASGGAAGVGGGGGVGSGIMGGILGGALNKAHIALDIRIVDTASSKVLAATRVQGQASDVTSAIKAGLSRKQGLGAALSTYANTPMEKAIRICITEAVRYISQSTPLNYYKY